MKEDITRAYQERPSTRGMPVVYMFNTWCCSEDYFKGLSGVYG